MTTDTQPENSQSDPRYLYFLFVSLMFMLLVVPLFESDALDVRERESGTLGGYLMHTGLTAVLITAAIASRRRHGVFYAMLFFVVVASSLSWSTRVFHHPTLIIVSCLMEAIFFVAMGVLIMISVVRRYMTSFHSVFGAICSYLLIGLAWAMIYLALLQADPGTFEGFSGESVAEFTDADRDPVELSKMIYYSFVTMSTLGYGDITPQTGIARTVSWMQSVTGQFYIAVLVAWLVSEIPRRRREEGLQ